MIEIPILGSLALAGGTVLERSILKIKKIKIGLYQTLGFLSIVLILFPFLFFFWKLDSEALQLKNILLFAGILACAVIANLLIFYSEKWEKITTLEPARILEPLFVILLAIIFSLFTQGLYDSNLRLIIPALISAFALIFPHIKRHHLHINRYILSAILGSFFFALELILSRLILDFYSPISFYFFRCLGILLISLIIFRKKLKLPEKKITLKIFLVGAIWVVYRIALYFGYLKLGVVFTTLITMLSTVFIYLLAFLFLKEKINWKNILSSIIIVASVVYVLLT